MIRIDMPFFQVGGEKTPELAILSTKVMAPATFASQLPGFKIFEDLQV